MLNNREIAIIIWSGILLIYLLKGRETRKTLLNVFRVLSSKLLLILFTLMFIYCFTIIYSLKRVGYWEFSLIKDTLLWLVFTALALLFDSTSKALEEGYFRTKVIENIKFIVIVQFIANTYTFNILIEIALTFILFLFGALQAVAKSNENYKPIRKVIDVLLSVSGTVILTNAIFLAIEDFKSFGSISTLKSFLLPIILTVTYLPFIYCLALYSIYEQINVRLKMKSYIDNKLRRYTMIKIILIFNFRLSSLREFQNNSILDLTKIRSKEDVIDFFNIGKV